MKISRFYGANTRDVMRQVREALGPDALIVSNRSVEGGIEVLATVDGAFDDTPAQTPPQESPGQARPAHAQPSYPQPSYSQPSHPQPPQERQPASSPFAAPAGAERGTWEATDGKDISRFVHDLVTRWHGSISAEHGIGQLKRDELARVADPVQLRLMQTVKRALDPHGLLNPGKLVPLAPEAPTP